MRSTTTISEITLLENRSINTIQYSRPRHGQKFHKHRAYPKPHLASGSPEAVRQFSSHPPRVVVTAIRVIFYCLTALHGRGGAGLDVNLIADTEGEAAERCWFSRATVIKACSS